MKAIATISLIVILAITVTYAQDIMTKMYANLDTYTEISEALASDNFKEAQTLAKKLDASINPSTTNSPSYKSIAPKVSALVKTEDIESFRKAFQELSVTIIPHVKMYGGLMRVKLFTCQDKKVEWMQRGDKPRNPYFGKKMLTCGTLVK